MATGRRLRVLFVAPSLPSPPDDGFSIRVYHLVRGVAARHDVWLVAHDDPHRDDGPLAPPLAGLLTVPPGSPVPRLRTAVSLLAGRSRARQQQATPQLLAAVARIAADIRPDLVQWETPFLVGPAVPGAVEVVDEHNLWAELVARRRAFQRSPLKRAVTSLEHRAVAREERRAWTRAHAVLFTSDREARVGRDHGARHPLVVPNGVDPDHFRPPADGGDPDHLLFVGLLSYGPNRDAVDVLLRNILPRVLHRRPATTLTLVGRNAPPALLRGLGPLVHHAGAVADVRPYLARAGTVVAPLRYGSGTRIKVLEAMAAGRPVVATSLAAEGLDVRHGEHLLFADSPEAFADAILRLREDEALAARLRAGGRALVERRYAWAQIADRLADEYLRLIEHYRGAPARIAMAAP